MHLSNKSQIMFFAFGLLFTGLPSTAVPAEALPNAAVSSVLPRARGWLQHLWGTRTSYPIRQLFSLITLRTRPFAKNGTAAAMITRRCCR